MTSATDELRRLLDERGVEWEDFDGEPTWAGGDGRMYYARQEFTFAGLTNEVTVYHLTPAQAIDATLGRGTCHAVFEVDAMSEDERIGEFVCSECGETFGDVRDQQPNYCPNCGRRCVG